jgi:hypothetical protein
MDEYLQSELLGASAKIKVDINDLIKDSQCQISH